MVTFKQMFKSIDKTLIIIGLCDIYKKIVTKKSNFMLFQRILYVVGFIHMLPLMAGELIQAAVLTISHADDEERFLKIAELVPCFITSFFCLLKSYTMVHKRKQIRELVEDFRKIWPEGNKNDEIEKIISQSMVPTNQFCWVYTVVTNVLSMVYNIFPLIVMLINRILYGYTNMLLPYYIWYPFDYNNSPEIYSILYTSQFYAGMFTTAAVSSVDCFFCLLVAHLCMHFKLLCRDIHRITFFNHRLLFSEEHQMEMRLKQAVIYHNKIMKLCAEVESVFSFIIFLNLLASSLMICLLTFSVTVSPPARLVKYIVFLSSSITQILMISWYGNKLMEESRSVGYAAYNSGWTSASRSYCRGVLMLQARAHKPTAISAMGFSNISLSTFSSILSAAWSYFTLLRTVYQKTDNIPDQPSI